MSMNQHNERYANAGLLYYKTYYDDRHSNKKIRWKENGEADKKKNAEFFDKKNQAIFDLELPKNIPFRYPDTFAQIPLVTTYPGLLVGSGLTHGSGLMGEMKLGLFLDYATGLPLIAGSSVKGSLRAAFPQFYRHHKHHKKAEQLVKLLQYHLQTITTQDWSGEAIDELETFIFGTPDPGNKTNPKPGSVIFHDALPTDNSRVRIHNQRHNQLFTDDYITPHKENLLKNPTPISFLKVMPGVAYCFQFQLQPFSSRTAPDCQLTIEQMTRLFEQLILDFGMGAKTNVGYGQLMTRADWDDHYKDQPANKFQKKKPPRQSTGNKSSQSSKNNNRRRGTGNTPFEGLNDLFNKKS